MDPFSAFKPLRNKLRHFSFESVLSLSVKKLHDLKNFPIQEVTKYPPWFLLLLIKWSALNSDPGYRRYRDAGRKMYRESFLASSSLAMTLCLIAWPKVNDKIVMPGAHPVPHFSSQFRFRIYCARFLLTSIQGSAIFS